MAIALVWLACGLAAAVDWRERRLPNHLTLPAAVVSLLWALSGADYSSWLGWWVALTGLHALVAVVPPYAMGGGDWKLVAALSPPALLGGWAMWWLTMSYLLASGHGLWLRLRRGEHRIPLGPWLWLPWSALAMGDLAHVAMADGW